MGMGEDKTCQTVLLYWTQSISLACLIFSMNLFSGLRFFPLVKIEI
jgi:hypothetical protein